MSQKKNENAISEMNLNSKQKRVLKQQENKNKNAVVVSAAKNAKGEIVNLNLNSYKNTVSQFGGLQSKGGSKETMYIYPAGTTEMMKIGKFGKNFRKNKRDTVNKFAGNCEYYAKNNLQKELLNEIAEFKKFYKEFYLVNDFSPASISKTENKIAATIICNLIKDVELQTAKKVVAKVKKAKVIKTPKILPEIKKDELVS